MPLLGVLIDTNRPEMQQLAPEVRAEVRRLAPSTVDDGSIFTKKLADNAVTYAKIAPGSVGGDRLGTGGVQTRALANGAVTEPKVADNAITRAKAGIGVVTAADPAGNAITLEAVPIEPAAFAAMNSPDPNVLWLVYED